MIKHGIARYAYATIACIVILFLNASSRELGVAFGFNTSLYTSWNSDGTQFQKVDFFNPIEVNFRTELNGFLGIHSALQYAKRSNSSAIQRTYIDPVTHSIERGGMLKYERSINYISLVACPLLFHTIKKTTLEARIGLSGDIYINEWVNEYGNAKTLRNNETLPFVLSFVSGVGFGYHINRKMNVGLRSGISVTLTDIYRNQVPDSKIYFVNVHSVIYASIML